MISLQSINPCIGLILTNDPYAFVENEVLPSLDPKCKHQIIHGKIDFHIPKYTRKVWDYGKSDVNAIRDEIRNTDWIYIFRYKSIDEIVEVFTDNLLLIAERFIPFKYINVNDKECPWITSDVRAEQINRNKRIYKKWVKRGKSMNDKCCVNDIQYETNKIIKDAKKSYIENLSEKICDPQSGAKIFWNVYKRLINNKKNTNIPAIIENARFVTNFPLKANIFNKYFACQCRSLDINATLPMFQLKTDVILSNFEVSIENIEKIIYEMNAKKAHGFDGISVALIKSCSWEIAYPLKLIFSKCLEMGIYPDKWKHANIQPVHKKNSRQVVSNYRPISLLPICGKIFEKLMFDSMYTFFQSQNLLSKNQSGFRPCDSTVNQLLSITTEIYEAFEDYEV